MTRAGTLTEPQAAQQLRTARLFYPFRKTPAMCAMPAHPSAPISRIMPCRRAGQPPPKTC
ncbi:hypothetical protein GCM10027345_03050 [Hymenobacter daeguensis]